MFRQALITTAFNALRFYVGTKPFDRISGLVESLIEDTSRTGSEKRNFVINSAISEFGTLSKAIIRAVIEVYLITKVPEVVGVTNK